MSDRFEWTAINSRERLAVLKHLPPQIPCLVRGESGDVFRQVFEVGNEKLTPGHAKW